MGYVGIVSVNYIIDSRVWAMWAWCLSTILCTVVYGLCGHGVCQLYYRLSCMGYVGTVSVNYIIDGVYSVWAMCAWCLSTILWTVVYGRCGHGVCQLYYVLLCTVYGLCGHGICQLYYVLLRMGYVLKL